MAAVKDVVEQFAFLPRLLYQKTLSYCRSNPDDFERAKQLYITAFDHYTEDLLTNGLHESIFECFQDAITLFPDDPETLNTLGVTLNRLQKPLEALNYFKKAHRLCPEKLKILENRDNVINEWIPRWHFVMLNDTSRNTAFRQAIFRKIHDGGTESVLDIGTGTGILMMYAHQAGAKELFACESNELMVEIATEVFRENKVNVLLLREYSAALTTGHLNNSRVDLIITETFDSGVFGEGVLSTLIHAKETLLKETGKILPEKVKVYVVGVDRIGVAGKLESIDSTMENSIYLKNTILVAKTDEPYDTYNSNDEQIILRTDPVHAFTVDLNDLESMKRANDGALDNTIQLSCTEEGSLEAFLVYFELELDENNILRNFEVPLSQTTSTTTKCWDPVVFPLIQPMPIRKYQILKVGVSCKNGILSLQHNYYETKKRIVKVDPELYTFLTDDEYLYELEYNVNRLLKKNRKSFHNFADFLPFPHIGINLLKEGKIETLYCSERIREFIEEIADWNCIAKDSIKFICDLEDFSCGQIKFDFILLQPITGYGNLNDDHLKHYVKLKANCLSSNGIIFPQKIDLCCKLIYSPWLQQVTRVENPELQQLGIQNRINEYATRHQFEFKTFDSSDLSENFTLTKIQMDEERFVKDQTVNLNMSQNRFNAILYHYKIFFTNCSIPIATNRKKSFCKQNCFVQEVDVTGKTSVVVRYIQDELTFRCEVVDS